MDKKDIARELVRMSRQLTAGTEKQAMPSVIEGRLKKIKAHLNRSMMEIHAAQQLMPADFNNSDSDDTFTILALALKDVEKALTMALEDIA